MHLRILSFLFLIVVYSNCSGQHDDLDILETRLDSLVSLGIDSMAFPGAQILVRHRDSVIFHKSWGHHTYDAKKSVKLNDIYDLASVTKVSTGLPILMKLYGANLLNLDAPIKNYFKSLKRSNKKDLTLRQMLTHQARLKPYIVFWQEAKKKNGKYRCRTFNDEYSKKYNVKITDNLYLHKRYRKKMAKKVQKSELRDEASYVYSGLTFLLMPEMIKDMIGRPMDDYLYDKVYGPIGASELIYNPLERISIDRIVPTEYDSVWRHEQVHGTVHDEAAAMLGGVSCNAGLFGSAESLSRLFQLYLNEGLWDGQEVIPSEAVREFTSYQYKDNRRGLGFDKPLREYDEALAYVAKDASPESYGHSGFTGTMVWADPKHDLVFVFLSNRVYPSRDHRNLYKLSLRPLMHQAVYNYLITKK